MAYRNEKAQRTQQSGQSYPNLQNGNPLQTVRDTYRQPQEDAYKMQSGRFMPEVNPNVNDSQSNGRATVRDGGYQPGDQNFDVRSQSFSSLDENMRERWIQSSVESTDGRK